ncbi:hypothetical protein INT45_014156, partial [Circinella minor]
HGRERVKDDPELLAKRRERESIKIKQYNELVEKCRTQFNNEDYSSETLLLTTRILEMNPDYYTIWNIRRLVLLRGILITHNNNEELKQEDIEHNNIIYKKELDLFMQLIRINPKSYWMWNHRRWILETMPKPNWVAELGLVEKLLSLDARNFHGWSYRRYVVQHMRQEAIDENNIEKIAQSEYDFTTKKINESFSNFSAWYQRTRLLPEIVQKLPEQERNSIAKDELYMVKEAIYTEPDDQSAWLYYRWIVGHVRDPVLFFGAFRFSSSHLVILIFDDDISLVSPPKMMDSSTGKTIEGSWLPINPTSAETSTTWVYKPWDTSKNPDSLSIEPNGLVASSLSKSISKTCLNKPILSIESDNDCILRLTQLEERFKSDQWPFSTTKRCFPSLSPATEQSSWHTLDHVNLLKEEILTVRELLEIEPDSKWALQTLAHFIEQLRLLDGYEKSNEALEEVIAIYEKLIKLDTYRRHRYQDARKCSISSSI